MNVLLVRAGALGDVLLLRRAVSALRTAGHNVELVAPSGPGQALIGAGPSEVARLWPWDGTAMAAVLAGDAGETPLLAALRAADAVVVYTRSTDVSAALRAVAKRVVASDPSPPAAGPHASLWLLEPLREIGVTSAADPPPLRFSADERAAAAPMLEQLPRAFIAVHPGSGSSGKNWPGERFAALAQRLARGRPALLALGPAENQSPAFLEREAGWVIARDLPVRVLATVLSQAGLFVGNDSGVSHLAAAAGAPTLALFGPTDPALWAPVGPGVHCLRAPLEELSIDTVCDLALSLLARDSSTNGRS